MISYISQRKSLFIKNLRCVWSWIKPLPEPMLTFCQLDSWDQISVKFESESYNFHSWNAFEINCRLLCEDIIIVVWIHVVINFIGKLTRFTNPAMHPFHIPQPFRTEPYSEWCIAGFGTGALWDLWDWFIDRLVKIWSVRGFTLQDSWPRRG